MTYDAREASDFDAAPIELYLFRGLDGTTYAYTSNATEVSRGSEIYQPVTMKRNALRNGTQEGDQHNLEVTLPARTPMVLDYATRITPPKLDLTIYRYHQGQDPQTEAVIYWMGPVVSFKLSGDLGIVRSTSIFGAALSGSVPSVYYQAPCNWVLYGAECQANATPWTFTRKPTAVGTSTVEISSFPAGKVDTDFLGGDVSCARTGEKRMIVAIVGTTITVTYPFADLKESDDIQIRAGCDHSFATCRDKFNNAKRYGGCRFIPWINPFAEGLE